MPEARANDSYTASELASEALRLFPPPIRRALLEDRAFRSQYTIVTQATMTLGKDLNFDRTTLFGALRTLYEVGEPVNVQSDADATWRLSFLDGSNRRVVMISRDDFRFEFTEFWPFARDPAQRLEAFERIADVCNFRDEEYSEWRELLSSRSITDEEFDQLHSATKATPQMMAAMIGREIASGTSNVSTLAPTSLRYYQRLVGNCGDSSGLADYVERVAKPFIANLLRWRNRDGLRFALLLSSHSHFSNCIDPDMVTLDTFSSVLDWLERKGDRCSQLGAIEFALGHLDRYPSVEPKLERLIGQFRDDDPSDDGGRLKLLTSLIALVDGELARAQVFRQLPPFWRRLAAIAQASMVECQLFQVASETASIADFAMSRGGRHFYMQSLVDLHREPRFLPEMMLPDQLRQEFLGRIFGAAKGNESKIQTDSLRDLIFGDSPRSIEKSLEFPSYCLAGPLEGAVLSQTDIPSDFKSKIEEDLTADVLTVNSFTRLVNSSMVYRLGPEIAQLGATALQRVKFQLRSDGPQDQSFALLSGLATLAGVTGSTQLADQVRILARVLARRSEPKIGPRDTLRICMVAAAGHRDPDKWRSFIGDWLTELAFGELDQKDAAVLLDDIELFGRIEPSLWRACGKAYAACQSLQYK